MSWRERKRRGDMKYPNDYINKIICGDCLEVMKGIPDKSVDLVLTDPPYGVGVASGTIGKQRKNKHNYDVYEDTSANVRFKIIPRISECFRIAKAMIITPGTKCLTYYPPPDSFGCFYQPATVGMQRWGFTDSQPIFYYGQPYDIGKTIKKCSFVLTERPSDKRHPCSKPLKIWQQIISDRTKEGDTVLDPFMGSGTTAVACKNLGRKFIGIEISPEYCKIADDRLRQEVLF
jgi:site-specific DNA-methyltransferase (adenine-specific)